LPAMPGRKVLTATVLLVIAVAAAVLAGALWLSARAAARRELAEAREEAEAILSDARRRAEAASQETLLEATERAPSTLSHAEQEAQRRLAETAEAEARIETREAAVSRRENEAESALEDAHRAGTEAEALSARARQDADAAAAHVREQARKLEEIAGMTPEQARVALMERVENELRGETARLIARTQNEARQEATETARRIVLSALSRVSGREVLDPVVTMVRLPGDEMKGRIIGREGRNIRTLELATGVDVII